MNEQQLYNLQYRAGGLPSQKASYPWLRRLFEHSTCHRDDLVMSLAANGKNFLDVGCGSGELIFKISNRFERLWGVDVAAVRIEQAREKAKLLPQAQKYSFLLCQPGAPLPLPNNFFDCVTCMATLEHVFDPYQLVAEMRRVLRPGGMLIIQVPNIAYVRYRLCLLLGRLPATSAASDWCTYGWDGGHLHYFTQKTLRLLLSQSGFADFKFTGSGLFAGWRNWWPSLLTGDICVRCIKE
ncbi:MAG: class I SAM-dependent methyltransferase [Parcubacteria group bacterium]